MNSDQEAGVREPKLMGLGWWAWARLGLMASAGALAGPVLGRGTDEARGAVPNPTPNLNMEEQHSPTPKDCRIKNGSLHLPPA